MIRGSAIYQNAVKQERRGVSLDDEAIAQAEADGATRTFSKYIHHFYGQVEGGI